MADLDNPKGIEKYDRSGMLKLIESFPAQCLEAKAIGDAFRLPEDYRSSYKNIVFTGLGGSAIGADLVRAYLADEMKLPVSVNRNYRLPGFVGRESLVIASSYSGDTEETLSAYRDARARGARVIAVTSGGELLRLAKEDGIGHIVIPKGLPPRCALGYSFFPLLILMSKFAFIGDRSKEIKETADLLTTMNEDNLGAGVPERRNAAKKTAGALHGKFPVIYGAQDHIDAIVTRWRGQLAENSKTIASSHIFPEMNHNEIVGWENPKDMLKRLAVILLRDRDDHPRTAKRMDITKNIIKKEHARVIEVRSVGKGLLSRIFSLVYMGDFVSLYLAILNRRDPTPVERVTYLKKELAKG